MVWNRAESGTALALPRPDTTAPGGPLNQIKLALRQLKLRPGLSFVVIAMLALGIGATTAMFSLYHQILLRPLPVPEPESLVNLAAPGPKGGGLQDVGLANLDAQFSYPMFRDLEREQTGFTGIAAYVDFLANLSFDDRPMSGRGYLVSGSFFGVLNLKPALGRFIGADDAPRVGESAVAVLSYEYWQRGLGGDPGVIGKTLTVNGNSLEIVGVAPQGFTGTVEDDLVEFWIPVETRCSDGCARLCRPTRVLNMQVSCPSRCRRGTPIAAVSGFPFSIGMRPRTGSRPASIRQTRGFSQRWESAFSKGETLRRAMDLAVAR